MLCIGCQPDYDARGPHAARAARMRGATGSFVFLLRQAVRAAELTTANIAENAPPV